MILLLASLAFAQEPPAEPDAPAESRLGLPADDMLALGDAMRGVGAGYAALLAYTEALADNPDKAGPKLGGMLYLADHIGDEQLLGDALRNWGVPTTAQPDEISEAQVLAARSHLQAGNLGQALDLAKSVKPGTTGHPEAEALRGIVLNLQGQPTAAIAAFLTAQGAGNAAGKGQRFEDVQELNLARTYYASKSYAKAIEYYAKVDPQSPWWIEATFERAWAHYMLGDMPGTLGLLINLQTPFFDEWYYPEGDMLRGQAFFMLCKFPEATKQIEAFTARYQPIAKQLDRNLGKVDASTAFAEVAAFEQGESTKLPAPILRPFKYEERFQDAQRAMGHAQDELTRIATAKLEGDAADLGLILLEQRQGEVINAEGERVLAKARAARAEIPERLQNLKITQLDILDFERRLFEKAAQTGSLDFGDQIGELRKTVRRKGYRYWPYDGEYWADELGSYRVFTRPDCPADMMTGQTP